MSQSEYETWTYLYSYLKTIYELQEDGSWKTIDVQSSSSIQTYRDTTTYTWTETVPASRIAEDNKNKIEDEAGPPPANAEAIYKESTINGKTTAISMLVEGDYRTYDIQQNILDEEINQLVAKKPQQLDLKAPRDMDDHVGGYTTSTSNIPKDAGAVGEDKKEKKGYDDISYWSGNTWTAEERHELFDAYVEGIYDFFIGDSINELADGEFNLVDDGLAVVDLGLNAVVGVKVAAAGVKVVKKGVSAAAKPIINAAKPVVESAANKVSNGVSKTITLLKKTGTSADNIVQEADNVADTVNNAVNKGNDVIGGTGNKIEDAVKGAGEVGKSPIVVTEDMINAAMKDAPLKTQQGVVSQPAIQRYVTKLENGEVAPPIKVDNGIIVDGNHRYVAGRIFGQEPSQIPWSGGNPSRVVDWSKLKIDPFDWGNK